MEIREMIAVIIVLISTVGVVAAILGAESYRSSAYTVDLIARAPERGNWQPRHVTVPVGEKVTMRIRNVDTVSHGFALPAFDVAAPEIKAGHVKVIEFTPDRKGTFPFMCTVWCSNHHMDMTGELTVE
ncbi:MAG: cupredoxin domain-containing protein [Candidatus Undinarchaeales archaeon]|nr:cupredoxin domain-containing protein [Candidatus Undinarchaeales archaeon]